MLAEIEVFAVDTDNSFARSFVEAILWDSASLDGEKILAGTALHGETEDEEVCLAYWVIKGCVESETGGRNRTEIDIARSYSKESKHDDAFPDSWSRSFFPQS